MANLLFLGILFPLIIPTSVAAASTTGFLSPILSPVVGDICKEVMCGKGSCRASTNGTSLYECVCDAGWKQTVLEDGDASLPFLPCILPNCTLDSSCSKPQSPSQDKSVNRTNQPLFSHVWWWFDNSSAACRWIDCGGGTCNETSTFSYSCICNAGYSNLLNVSAFPCYQQCQIGLNCANLGISVSNSSSSTSIANNNGTNQGSPITRGRKRWPSIFMILLIVFLRQ